MKKFLPHLLLTLIIGCQSTTQLRLTDRHLGLPLTGFGLCMNPYLYAFPNVPSEINESNVQVLESRIKDLKPQFVRIFFLQSWWDSDTDPVIAKNHPGMRQSFIRTARLAQDAGAQILVQFWYDPKRYADPDNVARRFTAAIRQMRSREGLTAVRFVTIQNEPNDDGKDITMEQYARVYQALDRAMRDQHIRDQVRIIGGDLLSPKQDQWFSFIGKELSPMLSAYSMHAYWDYSNTAKLHHRIEESANAVATMPSEEQRPLYATEFGVQGFRPTHAIEPGFAPDGRELADLPLYGQQIARFMLDAVNHGFIGTAQWDAYDVWYDRKMRYGVIGPVADKFPPKPAYHVLRLFTHNIPPGSLTLAIDHSDPNLTASAFSTPTHNLAIFILNNHPSSTHIRLTGLSPHQTFNMQSWNDNQTGTTSPHPPIESDSHGVITITIPSRALDVLTSHRM